MGKELLCKCDEIRREIEWLEGRIQDLRDDIHRIENGGTVRDMVKGGSGNDQIYHIEGMPVRDLERKKALIADRLVRLSGKQVELETALSEAEEYIMSIGNSRVRQALEHIYIDGWTQERTAMALHVERSTISKCIKPYI